MQMQTTPGATNGAPKKDISWKKLGQTAVGAVAGAVMDSVVLTGSALLHTVGDPVRHTPSAYVETMRSIHHDTEYGPKIHALAYVAATLLWPVGLAIVPLASTIYGAVQGGQEAYQNGIEAGVKKTWENAKELDKDAGDALKELKQENDRNSNPPAPPSSTFVNTPKKAA